MSLFLIENSLVLTKILFILLKYENNCNNFLFSIEKYNKLEYNRKYKCDIKKKIYKLNTT